jgi:uncharacterized protein
MPIALASLVCGLIFGVGLVISGMTQPAKVLGFLDVLGKWDPTLAFVMAGAVIVSAIGFALTKRRNAPIFVARFDTPALSTIDGRLVAGATLFGIGWGLVGLCPGPALVNLASALPTAMYFVGAMVVGMLLHDLWQQRAAQSRSANFFGSSDG